MKHRQYEMLLLAYLFSTGAMPAQDAAGCNDSTLISRFPGSVISECVNKEDDSYEFFGAGSRKGTNRRIEGEFHQWQYKVPSNATKAQVSRNLNTALRAAGYTQDFESEAAWNDYTWHRGRTWIQLHVDAESFHQYKQTIVIETALKQEIVATAAELSSGLATAGHAVVNGVFFDTGKAEVKPESAPALEQVAKLLKQDLRLKLFVVGHTDIVGALPANLALSAQRAAAVAKVLSAQYGVAADRLQSYGVGPYAPRASNENEDGRSQNRRVELVKRN